MTNETNLPAQLIETIKIQVEEAWLFAEDEELFRFVEVRPNGEIIVTARLNHDMDNPFWELSGVSIESVEPVVAGTTGWAWLGYDATYVVDSVQALEMLMDEYLNFEE